ncbi:MAG: DUF2955 domain-containing protein [Gammaproteobacteria bacterium]|nr:DUF2955 domain-containing protein [Gammaproteobacteria bacterium]
MHPLAARRILRLALGTALSMGVSQIAGWPLSFIAPVLTLLILALPLPAPGLKKGLVFVVALLAPMVGGLALLPFLAHARPIGILLLSLALFYSFYYTAKGGVPVLGTFMTVGLTLVVTIGSVNGDLLVVLIQALALNAVFGMAFVWVAHALMPDPPPDPAAAGRKKPQPPKTALPEARREALRSLLIVLPITLLFLFMSGSAAYTVVMIKVASMGQQASADSSAAMARSMFASTAWGGLGALLGWSLLSVWPSLLLYVLLIGLAGLVYGRGIFQGPAVHPQFSKWSYAYMTMIIILAPAVLDSPVGGGGTAILWRLFLFLVIAVYGYVAVAVFDAFWKKRPG